MNENELSKVILDCCFKIHKVLGPGLLESAYEEVLCYELRRCGLKLGRQVLVDFSYENVKMGLGFRMDVVVGNKVILELKSVDSVQPIHKKQLLTYLRLTGMKLGLLLNFNVELMKDGITRVVNNL